MGVAQVSALSGQAQVTKYLTKKPKKKKAKKPKKKGKRHG